MLDESYIVVVVCLVDVCSCVIVVDCSDEHECYDLKLVKEVFLIYPWLDIAINTFRCTKYHSNQFFYVCISSHMFIGSCGMLYIEVCLVLHVLHYEVCARFFKTVECCSVDFNSTKTKSLPRLAFTTFVFTTSMLDSESSLFKMNLVWFAIVFGLIFEMLCITTVLLCGNIVGGILSCRWNCSMMKHHSHTCQMFL